MSNFYIKSLDGLRGIAVLLVMVYHFSKMPMISFDFELGWIGVQLFFVLSGYLITRILLHDKKHNFSFYIKRFYWRRSLRIFPIYFLYLFVITAIYKITGEPTDFPFASAFLFTYTYNFSVLFDGWEITRLYSHLWSLSVEEQFYLIWPALVYFLSAVNLKRLCIALLVAIPILRHIIWITLAQTLATEELAQIGVYWFTFSHFDAFAIGALLNLLNESQQRRYVNLSWLFWLLVLSAGLLNLLNYGTPLTAYEWTSLGYLLPETKNLQHIWSYSLLNLLFGVIILRNIRLNSRWLSNNFLVFVGKISYGMYLYHFILIVVVEKMFEQPLINDYVTLVIYTGLVTFVSYLSYIILEKQLLALKNKKFKVSHD